MPRPYARARPVGPGSPPDTDPETGSVAGAWTGHDAVVSAVPRRPTRWDRTLSVGYLLGSIFFLVAAVTAVAGPVPWQRIAGLAGGILVAMLAIPAGADLFRPRGRLIDARAVRVGGPAVPDPDGPTLAVVVRTDFHMGRGKIASLVADTALAVTVSGGARAVRGWLRAGRGTIVLRVSGEDRLCGLGQQALNRGLPALLVRDAGHTQVAPGSAVCLAIGPATAKRVEAVTRGLRLM
jgi:PTH2 family peptidyl-tRNA hydrolase